ncbi:hypothetical protein CPC08DRAFT_766138 [Agrocybe pediades]|nr:hypothetical protein CPC08DRAFT_766138 [Agrocybe pediades]
MAIPPFTGLYKGGTRELPFILFLCQIPSETDLKANLTMPRAGQTMYDNGLTKQQRYVQRHKEKVYLANAKQRKAKRLKGPSIANTPNPSNPSKRSADHSWLSEIDSKIRIFDTCWDMASGWTDTDQFESSFMEVFF